jgi:hypothetical protein
MYQEVADKNFGDPFVFRHHRPDGTTISIEAVSWVIPLPAKPLIQRVMRRIDP